MVVKSVYTVKGYEPSQNEVAWTIAHMVNTSRRRCTPLKPRDLTLRSMEAVGKHLVDLGQIGKERIA